MAALFGHDHQRPSGLHRLHPRRSTALLAVVALLAALLTAAVATVTPADAAVRDSFDAGFSKQDNGAILLTGNSQFTCPTAASGCTAARAGGPFTNNNNNNNNGFTMGFIDADSSAATTNSTSAEVSLPAGSTVLFAKLVWGGRQQAGSGGVASTGNLAQVKFRTPASGANYETLTGARANVTLTDADNAGPYQASIDVTGRVQAGGSGTYWVGDIRAATGQDRYAGWSLVVAYSNPGLPLRDLRIFEGFADVTTDGNNDNVNIPISGFLTPLNGDVTAAIGVVAWEGDRGSAGDALKLGNTVLSDASHPAGNFFASAISDSGTNITNRNPNYVNTLGFDIAKVNATNVIPNGANSTTLNLTTAGDYYYPGIVTTQIDLFTPSFNSVSKTVVNLSGNSPAKAGDTLEYRITLTNTGADSASGAIVRDPLPVGVTFVPGSVNVTANPGGGTGLKTDQAGDDQAEYDAANRLVRVRVGTGANATAGGTLASNSTTSLTFRAIIDRDAAGTTLANIALLDYRAVVINTDYTYSGNAATSPVAALADLALTKTSTPTAQTAGSRVTYSLTASNNGPNAATGVRAVDTLPTGTTFVSATAPAGFACSTAGQIVTCAADTLANGAVAIIPITVTVGAGSATGVLNNTATISSTTTDDVPSNNTATASTSITQTADVSITQSAAPSPTVLAGNTLTYTLTASNSGPSNAANVVISDPIPTGTTFVSASTTAGTCAAANGTLSCPVGALAPGAQAVITMIVKVAPDTAVSSIVNTSTVSSTTPDAVNTNNTAATTVTVARSADLAVVTTATPNPTTAGSVETYTIQVTNNGPSAAAGVVVNAPAVTDLTIRTASSTLGTCTITAGAINCPVGALAVGASAVITVQADIAATRAAGPISYTGSATTTTTDPVAANNSATATVTVTTSADLSLTKSSNPATITAGSNVTYSLTVSNAGPSVATGATISDPLPAGLRFVSSPSGCTATNGGANVTCPAGTLAVGASTTLTFIASSPAGATGDITNTATVSATTGDPNTANNVAAVLSSTSQSADLSLTKTSAPAVPQSGGIITYTLTATNNGPSAATAVSVRDDLPAGISFASGSTAGGATCTAVGAVVTCPVGTLAAGASASITIVGNIAASTRGASTNTAVISSTTLDPNTGNNTATDNTNIRAVADLQVTLDPVAPSYAAGTEASYTLTVSNLGPGDAQGVVVTGAVPPGLTPVAGSTQGVCVVSGGTVTCDLGTVAAGATLPVITLRAIVNSSTLPGTVSGSAQIGSTTADSNTANNSDDAVITVTAAAALAITKVALPNPLVAGSAATYRIAVTNGGPSDARDVIISDILPTGLVPTSASSSQGNCTTTGQTVSCPAGAVPAGSTITVLIGVNVSSAATGTVTNTATATTSTGNAAPSSVTIATPVQIQADLNLTQTATPSTVAAGGAITYTFTLTNNGPSNADTVRFNNPLAAGVLVLPGGISSTGNACSAAGDNASVSCDFGTVAPGTSRTVVISAAVDPATAAGTALTNIGTVTSPTTDPTPADRVATVTTQVATVADLAVVVSPVTDPPVAGANQSFVISVSNNGPSNATNVVLRNPLPTGTTFVSATSNAGTCALEGTDVVCSVAAIGSGASVTVQLTYTLPSNVAGTSLTNTATVSSTTPTLSDPIPANNTNSATDIIAAESNLVLTKNVTSGPVVAGSPITYSFAVTNNGPSDAANVTIEDALPIGTTLVSATAAGGGNCSGTTTVTCIWPRLVNGSQATAQIIVAVPASTVVGTEITNTATARSDSLNPTAASATVTSTVTASADVSTTKTFLSGNPVAGGSVRWQIVVANAGPSQALAVSLTDTAPSAVIFTAATTDTGTCTVAGNGSGLNCALGTLNSGGSAIITVTGDLSTSLPSGQVINTAAATSTTPDPNSANNSGSSTVETTTRANLSITKSGSPSPVTAGTTATWTAVVTNNGPSVATGVFVTEPIPVDLNGYSGSINGGACAADSGSLVCAVGTLAPGASATITFTGTVSPARTTGSVGSTSTVTASTTDPDPTNNSAAAPIAIATNADLSTTLVGPASMNAGNSVTWNASISNLGPSNAQAAILTVSLPATGLVNPVVSGPGGACTISGSTAVCALGTLTPGANRAAVSITALIDPGYLGSLTPTVSVSSGTTDPATGNNQATATTTVAALADVSIYKVATQETLTPGQPVGWTITVTNSGPSTAKNVIVTDLIPTGVTAMTGRVAPDGPDCTSDISTLTCIIASVVPGQPVSIAVSGSLAASFGGAGLVNEASLTSDTPDSNLNDNTVTANTAVAGSADLSIVQALPSGPPVRGQDFDGRLLITNNGPSDSVTVVVRDVLTTDVLNAAASVIAGTGTCTVSAANEVECTFARIAVGETVEIQITGQFSPTAPETLTNAADVTSVTSDPNLVNNTTTATVNAESSVDLAIDLTGPATVVAGTPISWTAVVSNAGPSIAAGNALSAPAPIGVNEYKITRQNGSVCTDVTFCPLNDLASGASTTLTFTAIVLPGYTGADIRLGAAVTTATTEAVTANNTETVVTTVTRTADLSVITTADPKPLVAGEDGTYTIIVTNNGPSAAPTTIATDQLPDGVTIRTPGIITDAGSCGLVGRVVNCALGILAPGQSVTITVPFSVSPSFGPGPLINTATASSDIPDGTPANNTGSDTTVVSAYADLTVTKSGPVSVVAGDPFVWSIDVLNSGPSLARTVRLTDVLPLGTGEVSLRTTQGECTLTTDVDGRTTVDCPLGAVGIGQIARVDIIIDNVLDPSFINGEISNTATVTSATAEPLGGPVAPADGRTSTTTSAVTQSADISIIKVPISAVGVPGQDIRWRLTVANAGPSTAVAVILSEQLPAGVLNGYYQTSGGSAVLGINGTPCTPVAPCELGDLLPGSTNAINIVVGGQLDPAFVGTEITNSAVVTAATEGANPGNNDTSSTITVSPRAELSVALTANPATVNAGETLGWDVVITNSGPSVARNVVLTDPLPAAVSGGVLELEDGTPVVCTGNLVCALGDLPPGTTLTLRVRGTLSPTFTAATVSNTVSVSSGTPDTEPADDSDTAVTTVGTTADLTLVKSTTDSPILAGEIVNWTIAVTANGPSVARNVIVTDTLPTGLSGVALTPEIGSCVETVCTLGDLAPGTVVNIAVSATIDADTAAGTLVNAAAVTSDTADPTPVGDSPTAPVVVTRSTDLSLVKTISPDPVVPGEPVSFVLTLSNTGPSTAQDVVVTDALPLGIEDAVAATDNGTCTITDSVVTCLVQTMGPNSSAEILIAGTASADLATGDLANTASALTSTPDVVPGNNSSSVGAPTAPADLSVTQSGSASSAIPGQPFTWTIVVSNTGPGPARGVALTDSLPTGVTITDVSTDSGTCSPIDGQVLNCAIGTLAIGTQATITIIGTVSVRTAGTVRNTAAANSADDSNPANNIATLEVPVDAAADLAVVKTVTSGGEVAGSPVEWTVVVTNNGPTAANQVLLTDVIAASVTGVTTDLADCDVVAGCDLGTLTVGQSSTVVITGTIAPDFRGTLTNTASAASVTGALAAVPDPVPGNNSSTATSTVTGISDLTLTKAITNLPIIAGTEISYLLTVSNAGPSVATNTVISDPVPTGTTAVSATPSDDGTCLLGATITCTWPTLNVEQVRTATIVVEVASGTAENTEISNTATVATDSSDPTPAAATVAEPVTTSADLAASKTLLGGDPVAGGALTWQILVTNDGPSTAVDVTLSDTAPVGVTFTGSTTDVGTCSTTAGLTCDFGDLATGAAAIVTVTGTIGAGVPAGLIPNTAVVVSATPDPDPTNDSSTVSVNTTTRADLALTKTATANSVSAGGPIGWTVTVTNNGPSSATDVVITEPLPVGVTGYTGAIDGGGSCTTQDGVLTCVLGSLAPQGSISVVLSGIVDPALPAGNVGSTSIVGSGVLDPVPDNNSAAAPVAVATAADLSVSKDGPTTVVAGSPISWTITVTTGGPSVARAVSVTDLLPTGIVDPTISTTIGTCTDFVCALGDLAPGSNIEITVTGTVDPSAPAGQITNTAVLTSQTADPIVTDNQDEVTTVVTRSTDLSVIKTISPDPVVAGSPVTFTLDVQNAGPSSAQGIVLTDALPSGLSDPVVTTTEGDCTISAGAALTCTLDELAPLAATQVLVTGTADIPAGELANSVSVITSTPDTNLDNNSDSVGVPTAPADLRITKTADVDSVLPGGAITWTLTASNAGPGPARSVVVTDTLPTTVTVTSVTTSAGACADVESGVLTCEVGTIAVDSSVVVTVTAIVGTSVTSALVNAASVVSPDDAQTANNVTSLTTEVGAAADLVVTQQLISGGTVAGTRAVWQVEVVNNGPAAAPNSVLTFVLPTGVTGVRVDGATCVITGDVVTCRLGTLAVGQRVTLTLSADVDPSYRGALTLDSSAKSDVTDLTPADAAAATTSTVKAEIGLTVTKMATEDEITAGESVVYVITAGNTGPSTATGVQILERLPAGAVVTTAITEVGSYAAEIWTIGDLAPGVTVDLKLQVVLASSGDTVNTVQISSIEVGDVGGPAASAAVVVLPVPPPTAPGTPKPQLPMTGFAALGTLTWALWLLVVGFALLLTARGGSRREDRGGRHPDPLR